MSSIEQSQSRMWLTWLKPASGALAAGHGRSCPITPLSPLSSVDPGKRRRGKDTLPLSDGGQDKNRIFSS